MDPLLLSFVLISLALQLDEERDDATLAKRIKEGDRTAFRQFFDRYHRLLLGYLIKRGMDEENAQDIVQNAFIKIWESREHIDPSKSLKAFLFKIGYTRALNHFRDTAKFDAEADLSNRVSTDDSQHMAAFNQVNAYLMRVIQSMPERRRAVFELCFLEELTYREAAETLQVSVKTIENHMGHALKTVRAAMSKLTE